jgi:Double-GTPase 1
MNENASILVIGEHNVGKTNYGTQLFGRLRLEKSSLKLHGIPENISTFESGLRSLNNGEAPAHTASIANLELVLPIEFNQQRVSLTWPEYGGEQINDILHSRSLSKAWQNRIAKADGWMLFLRLNKIGDSLDAIAHPAPKAKGNIAKKSPKTEATDSIETLKPWNSNAKMIELVQMLLHEKRIGIHERVKSPALVVALSCWDELNIQERDKPHTVLKQNLPLLYEFLTTLWEADHLSIFGVSSLGMDIGSSVAKEALCNEGPEQYGFVIKPDGSRSSDLSEPVIWLMERIS